MNRQIYILFCCTALFLVGCGKKHPAQTPSEAKPPTPRAAVKLTVLVVDDAEIASGINLLRGEWAERSGGELSVEECTSQELLETEKLGCDLIVYPSRYLGTLVEQDALRPVRQSVLQDEQINFQDVFPLIRNRVLRYGGETYALTLGEPPLMLAWQGEAPGVFGEDKSLSWDQCPSLSRELESDLKGFNSPLAVELIVRAVSYCSQNGDSAYLFDSQTMEPKLAEPQFVHALSDMQAADQRENKDESLVRISWPTAMNKNENAQSSEDVAGMHFFALPQNKEMYDRSLESWTAVEEIQEPLAVLGVAGRLVSVSQNTRNTASAFKLLKWLARADTSTQVSQRSSATLWFRNSQVSQSTKWLRDRSVSDGATLAATKLLSSKNAYVLPRVPGIDQYLETLDQVVAKVLSGEIEVEQALTEVVARWQEITESLGKQRQQQAYRRHLGFNDQ